ncbi:RcnB family protein [Salinicola sp. DM10]|uniref:RcnB family protein n=1 Tax=Salinicola sp. DM10 TaxID=2815721 RepID=UPI001A8FEAD7|nr:RcnB family protein [Salinicola sp. DM10]MCE3028076.1 RcnB family protein [Salinicola sp. DM10]
MGNNRNTAYCLPPYSRLGRRLTALTLMATLGLSGAAQAHPGGGPGHGSGGPPGHARQHDHHHHERGHDRYHEPSRAWHPGGRIAARYYRDDRYWVRDWHARHLREPPRGHRWLNIDGDYVLAAVATGVITAIILNR